MGRLHQAAGVTAAALSVAACFAFAAPSVAGETDQVPVTASYFDHEAAAPIVSEAVITTIETPASAADLAPSADQVPQSDPAPVAQHALASVEQVVSGLSDEDAPDLQESPKSLSELVNEYASSEVPDADFECLATAVYFESKSEPLAGQLAVAEVIINRSRSGRFPASLCGVVKQRGQFSFVRGGQLPAVPRASAGWRTAVAISHIARNKLAFGKAPRALFFHARRVSPGWHLTRVAAVGNHVFYR